MLLFSSFVINKICLVFITFFNQGSPSFIPFFLSIFLSFFLSFFPSYSQDNATVQEVADALGMQQIRQKYWHVQASVATNGYGLIEGLDWLSKTVTSRV